MTSDRAKQRSTRRARRRAFTLIEVMLALVLASFVISAALGMLALVANAQKVHAGDITRTIRLTQAQSFFRDSFVRLVAGMPLAPPQESVPGQGEENEQDETDEEETPEDPPDESQPDEDDEESRFDEMLNNLLDGGMASQLLADEATQLDVMFEIYLDTSADPWPTPVMECVITDPPSLGRESNFAPDATVLDQLGFVRCEIRLEPQPNDELYTLYYVPLDPIGEAVPIIRDLEWASFHVLPSRDQMEWVDVYAAYLQEDFPAAIRIVMFLDDGREIDWLFEVQSIVPEAGT